MEYKALHIVLSGNILFDDLLMVIGEAFGVGLYVTDRKGRLEGGGQTEFYTILLIDKKDDLFEEPDEDYLLVLQPVDRRQSVEDIECQIKEILFAHHIAWKRGIWIPTFTHQALKSFFSE